MARWIRVALLLVMFAPAISADDRQKVDLPEMMRNHMLANMRDHLLALAEAQTLLAAEQWDAASELIERRLGMSSLEAHGASHMAQYMPAAMRERGTAMHRAASRLSRSLVEADPRQAWAGFAELMQHCVACHTQFRVH